VLLHTIGHKQEKHVTVLQVFSLILVTFRRVRKIAKSKYQLRHIGPFVHPSAWNNYSPTEGIFMIFSTGIFRKSVEKVQDSLKNDKNNGTVLYKKTSVCFSQFVG